MVFSTSPYYEASKLLNDVLINHKSLKSLVYSNSNNKTTNKMKCSKSSYALTCQTLQYKPILDDILQRNNGELYEKIQMKDCHNIGLAYILLYELLFGKYKTIRGGGSLKRSIMAQEQALRSAAASVVVSTASSTKTKADQDTKDRSNTLQPLLMPQFPKYVRVNTLKFDGSSTTSAAATVAQVLSEYIHQNLKKNETDKNGHSDSTNTDNNNNDDDVAIYADAHVPDLLVLSPKLDTTILYTHPFVSEGKIIFQDKSSCFPALCLTHGLLHTTTTSTTTTTTIDIMDACAAPGNKTTHVAALLHQLQQQQQTTFTSKIFALDRDSKRIEILKNRINLLVPPPTNTTTTTADKKKKATMKKAAKGITADTENHVNDEGGVNVIPMHMDFLQTKPNDPKFANVKAILLDPSCSGSGIVNQPDRMPQNKNSVKNDDDKQRLVSLRNFQIVALKHAMSFPQVDRIVYSTCSINEEENELVVGTAVQESSLDDGNNSSCWKICKPTCLDTWTRRGNIVTDLISKEDAQCMIRCDGLDGDETNGFFVCLLERQRSGITKKNPMADVTTTTTLSNTNGASSSIGGDNSGGRKYTNSLPVYNGQFRELHPCKGHIAGLPSRNKTEASEGAAQAKTTATTHPGKSTTTNTTSSSSSNSSSKKRKASSTSSNIIQEGTSTAEPTNNLDTTAQKNKKKKDQKKKSSSASDTDTQREVVDDRKKVKLIADDNDANSITKQNMKNNNITRGNRAGSNNTIHDKKKEKKLKWKLRQREFKQNRLSTKTKKEE